MVECAAGGRAAQVRFLVPRQNNMDVTVEPLSEKDDLAAISTIRRSILLTQGQIYPQALLEEFCAKYEPEKFRKKAREIEYFVAKDNKSIVGIIGLKENELHTFFVDPDIQGKGIGRQLYNYLENKARNRGCTKIIVEASPLGEPIYKQFGFKTLKTLYKERVGIKYTDAYMEKELV